MRQLIHFSTQRDCRKAECCHTSHLLNSSSSCHQKTLQDTPHINYDPLNTLNTRLKFVLAQLTIFLPLSHVVDQLGPRQKAYKISASASCKIKLNVLTALIQPIERISWTLHSVAASARCEKQSKCCNP